MIWQKAGASAVDCGLAILIGVALAHALGHIRHWKPAAVAAGLIYNLIFIERTLGMTLVGTHWHATPPLAYVMLYTCSFAMVLYKVYMPSDLLVAYGGCQFACVQLTGTTIPGYLTSVVSYGGSP